MYGENLKMGKDVRGIERGKCACGECEDFMRSDGATCGYCGCLPTRHSKKDARYSPDSVGGTSAAGTSESASPEKWKDEDLWWFPNPKGEYTEFSNSTLPKFYVFFLDHLSQQGTLSPLFRDWKKAPVGISRGFESNKSQNSARKHQNMGESGYGSRETIMLVGRR